MSRVCTKVTALLSLLLVVVGLTVDVVHPLSCDHAVAERCDLTRCDLTRCDVARCDIARCQFVERCDEGGSEQHRHDSDAAAHAALHDSAASSQPRAESREFAGRRDSTSSGARRDECPPLGSSHDEDCALCQYLAESIAVLFTEQSLESYESLEFAPIPEVVSPTARRQSIHRSRAPPAMS